MVERQSPKLEVRSSILRGGALFFVSCHNKAYCSEDTFGVDARGRLDQNIRRIRGMDATNVDMASRQIWM